MIWNGDHFSANLLESYLCTIKLNLIFFRINYFNKQVEDKQLAINSFVIPVIVALDNINISRPHHSHDRTL